MATRRVLIAALACAVIAATGCGSSDVTGSPDLPATFGPLKGGHGCPELAGLYAWPPSEGRAFGFDADGQPERGYRGGFLGLPVRDDAQVWIAESPDGAGRLSLHSRPANLLSVPPTQPAPDWTTKEPRYDCGRGWARLHREIVNTANPHGDVRVETRLAVLADGALAVGQMATVPQAPFGLTLSGFEVFSVARADRTVWSWAKLARIGDTGDEPATVEATQGESERR